MRLDPQGSTSDAALDAAWSELLDGGYASFTMEAVAGRAHTSRPMLYRRWPNRADLTIAAIRHFMRQDPVNTPDTGNVRGYLTALLEQFSKIRAQFAVFFSLQMSEYLSETNTSMADRTSRSERGFCEKAMRLLPDSNDITEEISEAALFA